MSKRSRFLIILGVLGLCLYCLWPSLNWYFWTSKDEQKIALGSLEKIRDYSIEKAVKAATELEGKVSANPSEIVPEEYNWLVKEAKNNLNGKQRQMV